MMIDLKQEIRWQELPEALRAGVRWWINELSFLIPKGIPAFLASAAGTTKLEFQEAGVLISRHYRGASSEVISISNSDFDDSEKLEAEIVRLKKTVDRFDRVVIELLDSTALRRQIKLPYTSHKNLSSLIKYEVERYSPLPIEHIHFNYRLLMRNKEANCSDVEIIIVKNEAVENALKHAHLLELDPDVIDLVAGDVNKPFYKIRHPSWQWYFRRWMTPALGLVVVFLFLMALALGFSRGEATLAGLNEQLRSIRPKVEDVRKLQDAVMFGRTRIEFLANSKKTPLLIEMLTEITKTLPDNSWLYEIQLDGKNVHLRGYSPRASELIGTFDRTELFSNAQFASPLTRAASGDLERFDLSLEVKGMRP